MLRVAKIRTTPKSSAASSKEVNVPRSPYLVLSFLFSIEKFSSKLKNFHADTTTSLFYFFNITGLEVNESVLEAELHLYRKRTPLKALHPSILASPYYLVSIYIYIYINCNLSILREFFYRMFRSLDKSVSSFGREKFGRSRSSQAAKC